MRLVYGSALAVALCAYLVAGIGAQPTAAQGQDERSRAIAGGGVSVPGWTGFVHPSREDQGLTLNDAKLTQSGNTFQVTTGPAVTYWNPTNTAAGNYTVGRGYDPGTLLGDRGIGAQFELRFGSIIPTSTRKMAAEPFLFFDAARVSNDNGDFLPRGQRSLTSIGAGVRGTWLGFGFDTAVAIPLQRTGFADRKPDARLLFSISRRLFPWGS